MDDGFRPEYIDAVKASLCNVCLIPYFVISPVTFAVCVFGEASNFVKWLSGVVCVCLMFFAVGGYMEIVSDARFDAAVTPEEKMDALGEPGRMGMACGGSLLAVIYTFTSWGLFELLMRVIRRSKSGT